MSFRTTLMMFVLVIACTINGKPVSLSGPSSPPPPPTEPGPAATEAAAPTTPAATGTAAPEKKGSTGGSGGTGKCGPPPPADLHPTCSASGEWIVDDVDDSEDTRLPDDVLKARAAIDIIRDLPCESGYKQFKRWDPKYRWMLNKCRKLCDRGGRDACVRPYMTKDESSPPEKGVCVPCEGHQVCAPYEQRNFCRWPLEPPDDYNP